MYYRFFNTKGRKNMVIYIISLYLQSYKGCMAGYYGLECSMPCPYPTYGVWCQDVCNCIEDLCDISVGCIFRTTGKHYH